MALTLIVAIVTGVVRWYYCRQVAHKLSSVSPYRTASFDKATYIIEAPHPSATRLSHHRLSVASVDETSCIKDSSITTTDRVSKLDLVDSPLTPSPPSFKSQRSSYAELTTTSRNVSFDSITTYQTLPSYHSRRASGSAFPPSAFPARPLPTLPNWS
ncbi:hypothetical protein VNI00_005980 [Paramarasmius palmivorus]|uniref:Uncharacterized protein n=1 Tax=Paramarasmius palmivorus TaxID=297713 RepID=A0AAW0DDY0_9AGAR